MSRKAIFFSSANVSGLKKFLTNLGLTIRSVISNKISPFRIGSAGSPDIRNYHLPRGQTASLSLAFSFMKQPHSLHWNVGRISLSQPAHSAILSAYLLSSAFGIFGSSMSQGRVVPSFFLYSCHALIVVPG